MITRMEVLSPQSTVPDLPLGGDMASDDPVQILDIQGLGPVKAEITTTGFAQSDGEIYQGSSVGKRNIVLSLGLNPNWADQTITSLRQLLYLYFMPKKKVKLRFFHEIIPVTSIEGVVESIEPNIFSQDPQIDVSIICPRPHFVDENPTVVVGEVDNGIDENVIDYEGTVATGFILTVSKPDGADPYTGPLTVINTGSETIGTFKVDPITIDADKAFQLITVQSNRRVRYIATVDGAYTNLLPLMSTDSIWPVLQPGENGIIVGATTDINHLFTLAYYARYGGL